MKNEVMYKKVLHPVNFLDRLAYMAYHNGGVVRITSARDALKSLSNMKSQWLYTELYRLVNDSDDWCKESAGVFRYLGPEPQFFSAAGVLIGHSMIPHLARGYEVKE